MTYASLGNAGTFWLAQEYIPQTNELAGTWFVMVDHYVGPDDMQSPRAALEAFAQDILSSDIWNELGQQYRDVFIAVLKRQIVMIESKDAERPT